MSTVYPVFYYDDIVTKWLVVLEKRILFVSWEILFYS